MIPAAYNYCDQDRVIVDTFDALAPHLKLGNYWADPGLENLKARVKTYYIDIQKTRCCYCQRHLGTKNHRQWDIEHIVPRAKHSHFLFVPKNLAASCPDCNKNKGDKEVLVNPRRKTYPTKSKDFKIIHPHYDQYHAHIKTFGMIYTPKTKKGKATIYACDLLRFATEFIDWENSAADTSFEAEIEVIFESSGHKVSQALEAIADKLPLK